jgi:hypothetical protein
MKLVLLFALLSATSAFAGPQFSGSYKYGTDSHYILSNDGYYLVSPSGPHGIVVMDPHGCQHFGTRFHGAIIWNDPDD